MDYSSYFIKNKAMFGSYPTQERVNELQENGVRIFVDTTVINEKKIIPYVTKYKYIHYPINDNTVPQDKASFVNFIYNICEKIENLRSGELLYLHCKGGHGRSGLVAACLVVKILNMNAKNAISYINDCHGKRKIMRSLWRKMGSPQTKQQKQFVYNMCRTIHITEEHPLSAKCMKNVRIDCNYCFNNVNDVFEYIFEKYSDDKTNILCKIILKQMYKTNIEYMNAVNNIGIRFFSIDNLYGRQMKKTIESIFIDEYILN